MDQIELMIRTVADETGIKFELRCYVDAAGAHARIVDLDNVRVPVYDPNHGEFPLHTIRPTIAEAVEELNRICTIDSTPVKN